MKFWLLKKRKEKKYLIVGAASENPSFTERTWKLKHGPYNSWDEADEARKQLLAK